MPNQGNSFRDKVVEYINSWEEPLEVLTEVNVGYRFVKTPRKLDIVIRNKTNNKYMAIECKVQLTSGSAYEKFSYALDDCIASPIPTIMAFAGPYIRDDMKSKLIMSGYGLELEYIVHDDDSSEISDFKSLFKQRCFIELGLNWIPFATGDKMKDQRARIALYADKIDNE